MYEALDIARYVINYAADRGNRITNLKLQKILYYIQGGFLANGKGPCFHNAILCWKHGPVVRNVYNEFSRYADGPIPPQTTYRKISLVNGRLEAVNKEFDSKFLDKEDMRLIDHIVDSLLPYGAWELVQKTHEEDPWENAKNYNDEISPKSIECYFKKNPERIYGKFDH